MTVVSNASALINTFASPSAALRAWLSASLARIGKLDLLRELYGQIVIPQAVWQEVVVEGAGQPGAHEVKSATWIKSQAATNGQLVHALQQDLDAGEAEAIALALEIEAELLLMDERLGRETARHSGLRYVGLIGVLIEAKHKGLIRAIKPHLDALRDVAGFRVKDALYLRVLQDEGEA